MLFRSVKALNAGVIDKVEGLGEVPVIVLASALEEAEREAYIADVAAREAEAAEAAARGAEQQQQAEAAGEPQARQTGGGLLGGLFGGGDEAAAPEEPAPGATTSCSTGQDGVKRCRVESSD